MNLCCSHCKIGTTVPVKEIKNGFASCIYWQCSNCLHKSQLVTSPKSGSSFDVNTRMVTAMKSSSVGGFPFKVVFVVTSTISFQGSFKMVETLSANMDMPSINRSAFFKRSAAIGQIMESAADEECNSALKEEIELSTQNGNKQVGISLDGHWEKPCGFNSLLVVV